MSSAIFLLVNTGRRSLFIFFPRSDSCLRTTLADLWSLNGRIIRTGVFAWALLSCGWFRDSMNLIIVELIRFSGYFSFKKIPFKFSHSSANRSGEDDRHWARFNMVVRRDRCPLQTIPSNDHVENTCVTPTIRRTKIFRKRCECLIYKMLFIQEKKPVLNTQSDSIKAKLFSA